MKVLSLIFTFLSTTIFLLAAPIPYSGKLSNNGLNYSGQANFIFEVIDKEGRVHWRNGLNEKATISVPVQNGRYLVLLGGQGMTILPSQLFLQNNKLFLRVQVDLNDGNGLQHLGPDQRITSTPHALSSDLAQRALIAEEAKTAMGVKEGAITGKMLSDSVKQGIAAPISASRLDPSLKAYLAPLLEPKVTGTLSDKNRLEGRSVTLSAPSTNGHNLSYQWKRDGNPIPGATSKDLIITDLNATTHSGNYKVVISNDFGSFSQQLTLNVFGATPVQVVAGDGHALFLDAMGFLYGVGNNQYGEIGSVHKLTSTPTRILDEPVAGIATGSQTSLILKKDGTLWGMGKLNNLGLDYPKIPVKVTDGPIKDFAAGEGTVYVVRTDGSLWSAGWNGDGRLGDGTTVTRSSLVKVIDSGVKRVVSRSKFTAVIKEDASLWMFGHNDKGQLGNGTQVNSSTPVQIESSGVVDVSTFSESTVYVKSDGSLWGMGRNHFKMLKDTVSLALSPVRIVESGVTKAAIAPFHIVYLKENGSVWGRGSNTWGQLGQSTGEIYGNPVQIVANGAVNVAAGGSWSMILMEDGKILSLGSNSSGVLGTREPMYYQTSQKVPGLKVKDVATNTNGSYFVDMNGSLWSVGYEDYGDLGNGIPNGEHTPIPVKVVDSNVSSVESRNNHVLFKDINGSLLGFGSGSNGRLDNNSTSSRLSPIMIYDGNITSFTAGGEHSAMVLTDGSLWTFGRNKYGQLGDGTTTDRLTPVKILDANVTQVAAGWHHTIFLKNNGSVWAMGRNQWGQLGDGTQVDRNTSLRVIDANATAVACGNDYSYVLMNDGSLLTFGNNGNGRTGFAYNGVNSLTTPQVVFAGGVSKVAAHSFHTLFLKTDGSLWSAGHNEKGRVGSGEIDASVPLAKIVNSGVAGMAAGGYHSIYWTTNGEVYVFGSNGSGQLGLPGRILSTHEKLVLYDSNP
jgi:alpha-tubulin suppressor-like RCC1 family protein